MASFDFEIKYKPQKENVIANALSRRPFLSIVQMLQGTIVMEEIKVAYQEDELAQQLIAGKRAHVEIKDGVILYKQRRVYVPCVAGLRKRLLREHHDTTWAGHPDHDKTMDLISCNF